MRNPFRRFVAALATAAILVALAAPAAAFENTGNQPNAVPIVLDILVLRPVGLVLTLAGALFYTVPVAPIMLITRPGDMAKPLATLVGAPGRFTFLDPIGQH